MNIHFSKKAHKDYLWWQKNNETLFKRIQSLLISIKETPYKGIGKPEPLKFEFQGYWSRRINQEHRLVYTIIDKKIYVASCRYHY